MKNFLARLSQNAVIVALGLIAVLVVGIVMGEPSAHALPEYVERTGEPCATCHVNPGGGGPRTPRGMLWAAQGRPDVVPELENVITSPGVADAVELYDISCAKCHGASGEGLFGQTLTGSEITGFQIRNMILTGRESRGMPGFEGQFTDTQFDVLVSYVTGIASGQIEPAPAGYPLPSGELECVNNPIPERCGGN